MSRLKSSLPETLASSVKTTIADWQSKGNVKRLWDRDASLWTGDDEAKWLGWLDIVDEQDIDLAIFGAKRFGLLETNGIDDFVSKLFRCYI